MSGDTIALLGVGVTGVGVLLAFIQNVRTSQQQMHKENRNEFQEIKTSVQEICAEREYMPSHIHPEKAGPLMAENVRYRQRP